MQFLGFQRQGQQYSQFQCAALLVVALRFGDGLAQILDASEVALSDTQALAGDERGVDVISGQYNARLLPVAELLGGTHGMRCRIQAVFQRGNACTLQPGRTENTRGVSDLAQLVEVSQMAHPALAVAIEICDARQQHV
ncbi:hypothetical protein D3C81_1166330 [compost metagenome]